VRALKRVDAMFAKFETGLLIASFLVLVGLGVVQIVLRIFGQSVSWADEVMRNITIWVALLGASLATWEGGHLNVDTVTHFLGPRVKAFSGIFVGLAASFISALVAYSGWVTFGRLIERLGQHDPGATLSSGIPVAVWQIMIPLGFSIIALRFLIKAGEAVWILRTGGEVRKISEDGSEAAEGAVRKAGEGGGHA
jgi:TRAP-type C4-dicarboxylate transport system permease small subunit